MALGSTLPFLCAFSATNLFGHLIDGMSKGHNRTRVNKLFVIPFARAAGLLVVISKSSGPLAIVLLLCASSTLMTSATPVYASGSLDLLPGFAGTFVDTQNLIASLVGVLTLAVTGYLAATTG